MVAREVEGIERSWVARGRSTERSCTTDREVQQASIVGDEVTVLVYDANGNEGDVLTVCLDRLSVSR